MSTPRGRTNREVRAELLKLCKKTRKKRSELEAGELEGLQGICAEADELAEKVNNPRDNALSAEVFADLSDVGAKRAQRLTQTSDHISMSGFISLLRKRCIEEEGDAESFNWRKLAGIAGDALIKPTVGMSCMLGPMSIKAKERKARIHRQRESVAELVEPEKMQEVAKREDIDRQTDKMMEVMMRVLKAESQPIPFVELVLNHDSFAQTIENIFALSFLVKDKRVDFSQDEELGVMVSWKHRNKSGGKRGADGESAVEPKTNVQRILSFNWKVFEDMKRIARREDCKMPSRPRVVSQQDTQTVAGPSTLMETEIIADSAEASRMALHPESPNGSVCQVNERPCSAAGKGATSSGLRVNENRITRKQKTTARKRKADSANVTPRKRLVLGNSAVVLNSPPPVRAS